MQVLLGATTLIFCCCRVVAFGSQDLGPRTLIFGSQDLGPRTLIFGSQDLGPRTLIFGSQDLGPRTLIFGSQDLGPRTSINGHWVSGPGSPSYGRRPSKSTGARSCVFPVTFLYVQWSQTSFFSACSGHRHHFSLRAVVTDITFLCVQWSQTNAHMHARTQQVTLYIRFEKISKNIPNNFIIFQGLGMILVITTKFINQKHYIRMFTTSILKCMKKTKYSHQKNSTIFKYLNFNFQATHKF